MKPIDLRETQILAERFSKLVDSVPDGQMKSFQIEGGKLSASIRRCSMDLTNALANLRKSPYQR